MKHCDGIGRIVDNPSRPGQVAGARIETHNHHEKIHPPSVAPVRWLGRGLKRPWWWRVATVVHVAPVRWLGRGLKPMNAKNREGFVMSPRSGGWGAD